MFYPKVYPMSIANNDCSWLTLLKPGSPACGKFAGSLSLLCRQELWDTPAFLVSPSAVGFPSYFQARETDSPWWMWKLAQVFKVRDCNMLPFGTGWHVYWKWPSIVNFPMKNDDFLSFVAVFDVIWSHLIHHDHDYWLLQIHDQVTAASILCQVISQSALKTLAEKSRACYWQMRCNLTDFWDRQKDG